MKKCPQCGISIEDNIYQCGYCQSDLPGEKKSQPVSGQLDLKRRQEAAEAAKWEREQAARIKQEQFEQQVFETLNIVIEKLERGTNIKLYIKLETYSGILAGIILIIGIISFRFLETEAIVTIGITWAAVGIIYLILSKIAKEKLEFFKTDVCNNMEAHFGQSWHPYEKTCISKIYQKYN